ncbi:hypothetical protein Val02_19560 [Virgisporangium aliadipatigenens]|uniref:Uncharacterized protein n=1 Tax=Virgisporangium aliadipatigenens TaxID=741659 RepID=A0A8J4DNN0_9ACTN|nr:hypothetical protein [Virgisporangium aliadipatigenens]GIJ45070.1 hypothetical protein Val02_19560 [Virgisporangium aliadipatigenens]
MLLRDLLDDAVETAPPAAPLDVDTLYRAATRRRRTLAAARAAPVFALVAALVATLLVTRGGDRPDPYTGPAEGRQWPAVVWAGAADARHLYATLRECRDCDVVIRGSDDGGRTWTTRSEADLARGELNEPVPDDAWIDGLLGNEMRFTPSGGIVLGATVEARAPSTDGAGLAAIGSTDGARTWRPLYRTDTPIAAAPHDSVLRCTNDITGAGRQDGCVVDVLDPFVGTFAPLANQPPLRADSVRRFPDGTTWVTGTDRATGHPAVAVSPDLGLTWQPHVFTEVPPRDPNTARYDLSVATRDGSSANVTIAAPEGAAAWVFMRSRADAWSGGVMAGGTGGPLVGSYLAAGDAHVVITHDTAPEPSAKATYGAGVLPPRPDRLTYRIGEPGRPYRELTGPAFETGNPVVVTRDDRYVTFNRWVLLISDDGADWRTVPIR